MLEQAVINLLRNSADAVTGAEQPQIEISCELHDGRVALAISDNGCGIPDARREQIFVPFFTTKTGGSGIGLNLARQVALAHGGQLESRANSPRGSVFTLTLPARQ
jgi:two-component system C4-dicarboxylate transport sensor histidine kinase DctB